MSLRRALAVCAVVAAVLGLALAGAVEGQAPTIPLPSDVTVTPPAVEVPESVSRFAGVWAHGAWDGMLPHVLIVETIESNGRAQLVYALGDSPEVGIKRGYRRVTGRIVADLLMFDLAEGTSVTYQLADGVLRGTYTSRRTRSSVILTPATLAEAMAVPATVPGLVPGVTIRIPMTQTAEGGGAITLEATVYRPPLDGPSPVVLFNHGSTGSGVIQPRVTLRSSRQAQVFVHRGFAVLAPMRRGRGTSEGTYQEYEGTCDRDLLRAGVDRGIADVDAAVAYLRTQAWADPQRLLIAGQSRAPSCPWCTPPRGPAWSAASSTSPAAGRASVATRVVAASTVTCLPRRADARTFRRCGSMPKRTASIPRPGSAATMRRLPRPAESPHSSSFRRSVPTVTVWWITPGSGSRQSTASCGR